MVFDSISIEKAYRIMHPRQVVLITTINKNNEPNVAPIAWNMPLSHKKSYVAISVAKIHKTHENILATQEFVMNFPEIDLANAVMICASKEPDKIKKSKLTISPSKITKTPKINECYAHMECRLKDKVDLFDHTLFIGECVYADFKSGSFDKFKLSVSKVRPLYHIGEKSFVSLDKTSIEL